MKTFRELINLVETAQPMTHNNYILQLAQQAGAELYAGQDILVNGKDANDFVENFVRLLINACADACYNESNEVNLDNSELLKMFGL